MRRRAFGAAAASALTLLPLAAVAARWPIEGRHYTRLRRQPATTSAAGVEVLEFFTYGCRPCRDLQRTLTQWQTSLRTSVTFRRMPVAVWDDFAILQDLYFAIEVLGLVEDLHPKVFDALQREHRRLEEEEQIGDFVARHGIDRSRFLAVLNSDEVASKSLEARRLADVFQVSRTPTFIVGRQWATDIARAGSATKAVEVVDFLVQSRR